MTKSAVQIAQAAAIEAVRARAAQSPVYHAYGVVDLQPVKTYATKENALKAVQKKFVNLKSDTRLFNVVILPTEDGRFFPVLCNCSQSNGGFQIAIHSGFNVIN